MQSKTSGGQIQNVVAPTPDSRPTTILTDQLPLMPFQLEFTRAMWLLGLCVVPVLGYYFVYSLVDFTRRQRLASLVCRSLVVTLLVLSLAGLTLLQPTKQEFVLFALDRSLSIGDASQAVIDKYLDEALPHAGDRRMA